MLALAQVLHELRNEALLKRVQQFDFDGKLGVERSGLVCFDEHLVPLVSGDIFGGSLARGVVVGGVGVEICVASDAQTKNHLDEIFGRGRHFVWAFSRS